MSVNDLGDRVGWGGGRRGGEIGHTDIEKFLVSSSRVGCGCL